MKVMGRGALIVFEGCDRAGKSTQVRMLVDTLTKIGICTATRGFPNRSSEIGAVINQYLTCKKDYAPETVHLLFSANRWEYKEEIENMLKAGTTVILDRYAASGAAYGAVNTGRDLSWCKSADKGLPAPDLVALLKVDTQAQESRNGWAEERYEKAEFQKKVAENFNKLKENTWTVIEKGDVHEVHSQIFTKVTETIKSVSDLPLKTLYES